LTGLYIYRCKDALGNRDEFLKQPRAIKDFDGTAIIVMSTTMNEELSDRMKNDGANYV
jgi:hypothetical protein